MSRDSADLSDNEFKALGTALAALPTTWPIGLSAIKFLALTGLASRRSCWRWQDLDLPRRTAHLPD